MNIQQLFNERLGRYQAAMSLEPSDRIPIAPPMNYLAEIYSGSNHQQNIYDAQKLLESEMAFIREFPETDVLRSNRIWGPMCDVIGLNTYTLPGRELPITGQFQFMERENMKADEYDALISNPAAFMMERLIPRLFSEMEKDSSRSHFAFLKAGLAQGRRSEILKNRNHQLEVQCGIPQAGLGGFIAPFDVLSNALRGLKGALIDTYRQPDKVIEACKVLTPIMARFALANADPQKRVPIVVPTHKPCFLSPKQFETFYWPSFKHILEILVASGYKVRILLEGDWSKHWHHLLELPKGTLVCDIDDRSDIFQAKKEIGFHHCIAGGISNELFILGSPGEIKEQVKLLCNTVGKDGGYIISGACLVPYETKPENYRAMIDAIMQYGWYDKTLKPTPKPLSKAENVFVPQGYLTSWETKKAELGNITGDEDLIRIPWEAIEQEAFTWLWSWAW
ncbi:MAG: uroporphyrinogen decarboxylase family protein [Bacillota bacterium]